MSSSLILKRIRYILFIILMVTLALGAFAQLRPAQAMPQTSLPPDTPVTLRLAAPLTQTQSTVSFSSDAYTTTEGMTALITATLSVTSNKTITVGYTTMNGTALAGQDYTLSAGVLVFNPGDHALTFAVPTLNDFEYEMTETLVLSFTAPISNVVLGTIPTATLTILDNDFKLQNIQITPSINEGEEATLTGEILAANPNALFTMTVNWDDGSNSSFVNMQAGLYSKTHPYLDDEPSGTVSDGYTVTLSLTDGMNEVITHTNLTVNNVAPQVNAGPDQTVLTGQVVTFAGISTDPGTLDTFTYLWAFGDGATDTSGLNPTHPYTTNGVYTVTLHVTDDDLGIGASALVVTVTNAGPAIENLAITTPISENAVATLTGTIVDPNPNDTFILTVAWGDGSEDEYTFTQAGPFIKTHLYLDDNPSGTPTDDYTLSLLLTDGINDVMTNTTITVNNVAPTLTANANSTQVLIEQPVIMTATLTDAGISDALTLIWDFGDGITSTSMISPTSIVTRTLVQTHTYVAMLQIKAYTITLKSADDDGGASLPYSIPIVLHPYQIYLPIARNRYPQADLSIHGPSDLEIAIGEEIPVTFTIMNVGPHAVNRIVFMMDITPYSGSELLFTDGPPECIVTVPLNCDLGVTLNPAESVNINFTLMPLASKTYTWSANISAPPLDPDPDNNKTEFALTVNSPLQNGTFTDGVSSWALKNEGLPTTYLAIGNEFQFPLFPQDQEHAGAVLLGRPGYSCNSTGVPLGYAAAEQTLTLPDVPEGYHLELHFQYIIHTQDAASEFFDRFEVYLNNATAPAFYDGNDVNTGLGCNNWWRVPGPFNPRPPDGATDTGWATGTIDLTSYTGQSITLSFRNYSRGDGWYNTYTFLDNIELVLVADE